MKGQLALACLALALVAPLFGPLAAAAGSCIALGSLLAWAARSPCSPSPSSTQALLGAGLTAALLFPTLLLASKPLPGLLWLLGPGYLLAAPLYLWLYHRSLRSGQ